MTRRDDGLLASARTHGLPLISDSLELNESGLDFVAGFAKDRNGVEWVLRIPRRADVLSAAEYESQVLALVRPYLDVAIPDWKVHTADLIAYPRLIGTPAATLDTATSSYAWHIDPQSPSPVFLDSLAHTLATLHAIPSERAGEAGLRIQSPAEARHTLAAQMRETRRIIKVPDAIWTRWQRWMADDTFWPDASALL